MRPDRPRHRCSPARGGSSTSTRACVTAYHRDTAPWEQPLAAGRPESFPPRAFTFLPPLFVIVRVYCCRLFVIQPPCACGLSRVRFFNSKNYRQAGRQAREREKHAPNDVPQVEPCRFLHSKYATASTAARIEQFRQCAVRIKLRFFAIRVNVFDLL